jgi:predicted transglutaminase-like cysteine proteinase
MGRGIEGIAGAPSRRRLLTWLGAAGLAGLGPHPASAATEDPALPPVVIPGLFGSGETQVGDPRRYVPKSSVLDRAFAGPEQPLMQAAAGGSALRWERLIVELSPRAPEAQIHAVDRFANAIAWVEDAELYGEADHWATPAEFLRAEGGDCEDFAIAKYFLLRLLGMPAADLRVTVLTGRDRSEVHAVLLARLNGEWLVLDNRLEEPRPLRGYEGWILQYGVSEAGGFRYGSTQQGPSGRILKSPANR